MLAVGLFFSQPANAEPSAWLDWSPPPECPPASYIEHRVTEWLGVSLPSDGHLLVKTALSWNGKRWEVTVAVSFGGQSGTRQVAVRDCQDAADFVAVAVALAVDPSLAKRTDLPAPGPTEAEAEPEATHDDDTLADRGSPTTAPDATKPRLAPAHSPTATEPRDPAWSFNPHASVAAEGAVRLLPEPDLGVAAGLGADIGRLTLDLSAHWLSPHSTAPDRAVAPIRFSLLGGRVSAAYLFFGPPARVGPVLGMDGGAIRTRQLGSDRKAVVEPWFSVGAGVLGLVALDRYVSLFGELQLDLPLTRPTFVLSDESVVHRVGIGARADLGLRIFFSSE